MRTAHAAFAMLVLCGSTLPSAFASAAPVFSTGGPCVTDAASQAPEGSRRVVLSNPSKLHLEASLKRTIDEANFNYADTEGKDRLSAFPYRYQMFVPPNGSESVGGTAIFANSGVAAQTFVLEHTDYFLAPPSNFHEEARLFVGVVHVGKDAHLVNFHPIRTIHVSLVRPGGAPARIDLPPQAMSKAVLSKGARRRGST